jgi:hypothetical protein
VGITQLFGFLARQCHQPSLRLSSNDGIASRTRTVIERLDGTVNLAARPLAEAHRGG